MPSESPLFTNEQEHMRLLNALRESELLRELSALMASSLDTNHILRVLVKRTTEVCEVERCTVWLLDETQTIFKPATYYLSMQHLNSREVQASESIWFRSTLSFDHPVVHRLFEGDGMLAIADLHDEPSMRLLAEKFLVCSILLVALVREGRPVGMMSLDHPGKAASFTTEQQQLARAIGQQASVAIDNARLYQQAQAEQKRAEGLIERAELIYEVAMAVNSGEELSTVLGIATQHLVQHLAADGGAIALLDADTVFLATTTEPQDYTTPLMTPHLTDLPHCCSVALQGRAHIVPFQQVTGIEKRWFEQLGLQHTLIIPLTIGTRGRRASRDHDGHDVLRCVGFAFVNYRQHLRHLSKGLFAFTQDIATQCALAIEKTQLLADTRRAAILAMERANTLDAVFNAMTEGIVVLDQEGRLLTSNHTASHLLGMSLQSKETLDTLLERNPAYTLHGQRLSYDDFPLTRALRGEQIHGERIVTLRADATERIVEVNIAPLFDDVACQIGIVSAFRDITEQVRVERRIRQALETLLHATEAISGITNSKAILQRVLAMTLTALNCECGIVQLYDQERQSFTPLLSLGFSEDAEARWLEVHQRWFEPGASVRVQVMEGHATVISADRYPEVSDMPANTMILAVPITHEQHLLGMLLLDGCSLQYHEELPEPAITQQLRREFTLWDLALVEGIAHLAGLALEETRWQQEAELARTSEAAMRESNVLKDEFLAITAHEFRTPLTIILAHSQMLLRTLRRSAEIKAREKLQESASIIEEQTHQLTNIVNTFLEVTRLNRGQIALHLEPVDLAEIVRQAVANHSGLSTLHHLSLSLEESTYPYMVMGDQARLLQIFANLLQNAMKYSPFGGPITLSLRQCTNKQGSHIAEVSIEDKGIGIPKEAQPRLFERFYRAPNVEGSKTRGVGLGLYIVSEFLHLHNGTIRVESSGVYGEGSRFLITLPLCDLPTD